MNHTKLSFFILQAACGGTYQATADRLNAHPDAPRHVTRQAVHQWQTKSKIPKAWGPIIEDITQGKVTRADLVS